MNSSPSSRTVVVLGASYAGPFVSSSRFYTSNDTPHSTGHRAVHLLVDSLPDGWRVVVIERNTFVLFVLYQLLTLIVITAISIV